MAAKGPSGIVYGPLHFSTRTYLGYNALVAGDRNMAVELLFRWLLSSSSVCHGLAARLLFVGVPSSTTIPHTRTYHQLPLRVRRRRTLRLSRVILVSPPLHASRFFTFSNRSNTTQLERFHLTAIAVRNTCHLSSLFSSNSLSVTAQTSALQSPHQSLTDRARSHCSPRSSGTVTY